MSVTRKTTNAGSSAKVTVHRDRSAGPSDRNSKTNGVKKAAAAKTTARASSTSKQIDKMLTVIERKGEALSAGADRLLKRVF